MFRSLCTLVFLSGMCALVYQSMWFRALRTVFGASTPANAAVLAIFMAGLGVGGAFFGRRVERTASPLAFYARLELGVAATAALSPFLVDAVRAVYLALGGSSSLGSFGATAVRLVLAAIALGPSAFLMGGTFPAVARAAAADDDVTRRSLALLYGINTLGAVAGVALSTFAFLDLFGVRQSIWCAALVNVLVALGARSLSRNASAPPQSSQSSPSSPSSQSSPSPSSPSSPSSQSRSVSSSSSPSSQSPSQASVRSPAIFLGAAFATGFAFFLLELVWYRMCAPLLGGSTYSFGVVLALALFGTGAGGALYAVFPPRVATPARFAFTCALEALLLIVPYACGDGVALLAFHLREMGAWSFGALASTWIVVAGVLVVPAAVVAGWQFPLLLALKGKGATDAGKDSGELYAANTAGAIAGSLVGGFGALPALSAPGAWQLAALVLVVAGVAFALSSWRSERARSLASVVVAGVVVVVVVVARGPSAVWRHAGVGAGRADLRSTSWNQHEQKAQDAQRLILEDGDGVESGLAFKVGYASGLSLIVGGKSDGSSVGDAPTQIGLGLVPALLHGNVKRAFVVGIGTGQSAGWLGAIPEIERVDVAEIEPRVLRFAELCADTNADMARNPKVHVLFGDGREALMTSSLTYDLVVSEPSNPYRAGVSSFYARELYEAAFEKLAPDGVFAQWIQSYEVEPAAVQTAVATLGSVFANVSAWRLRPGDMLLVATKGAEAHDAQILDVDRIARDLGREPYRTAFTEVMRVDGVEGVAALHQASPAFMKRLAHNAPALNSDDRPTLELSFARSVGRNFDNPLDALMPLARGTGDDVPRASTPLDRARVDAQRARPWILIGKTPPPSTGVSFDAGVPPPLTGACDAAWKALDDALANEAHNDTDVDEAGVAAAARTAFASARADPWCFQPLRHDVLVKLRTAALPGDDVVGAVLTSLVEKPFAGYADEIDRLLTAHALAKRLARPAPPPACMSIYRALEPHPIWDIEWLRARVVCYERHAHHDADDVDLVAAARADLRAMVEHQTATLADLLAPPRAPPP